MENSKENGYAANGGASKFYRQLQQAQLEQEEDFGVVFYNYLRALLKGKWVILFLFLVSTTIGILVSRSQKNIYEGVTSVLVKNTKSSASVVVSLDLQERESYADEIEILKSRTVAEEVAYKLLQIVFKDETTKKDTLDIIREEDGKISNIDAIAARVRSGISIAQPKATSTSILLISFKSFDPFEAATVSRAIASVYQERKKKSSSNTARILREFLEDQLAQKKRQLAESERTLQSYMEENRVVSLNEEATRMIGRYSQAQAQLDETGVLLNALTASLKQYNEELAALQPKLSNSAVQASIEPYTKQFQQEIARLEFERDKVLADPGSQTNLNVQERIRQYEDQIESYKKKLQQAFDRQVKQGLANVDNSQYFKEIYRKKLETELQIIGLQTKLKAYKDLAQDYDRAFLKTPGKNIEFARLQRNNQTLQDLYSLLEKRYQEALIAEEQIPSGVEVIDLAVPNLLPVGPNRATNVILGVVVGLVLGVGVVMLLQFLDQSVHTPEQAEKLGTLLATIPVIETFDESVRGKAGTEVKAEDETDLEYKKIASHLVTHFDPKSSVSESYRALRTSILFSSSFVGNGEKEEGNVFAVTSASPKEGKSTTISNLAITIAQGGQKVLLIDTDLRRPVVHAIFGYNKEPGITNHLVGRAALDDIIRSSAIPNLDIITSGTIPPNPSELLGSDRSREFITQVRQRYDTILFDTPPVLAVTDAQVLATQVDGIMIVIAAGQTQVELAKRARQAVARVDGRFLGFILNNFDVANSYGSYYKYYRYYNYYYESKGTPKIKKSFIEQLSDRFIRN